MGLGLSIVKGIVEAHEGIIREVGKAGEGARFVIYLPVESGS
jgi:signal transduction histidine kinase